MDEVTDELMSVTSDSHINLLPHSTRENQLAILVIHYSEIEHLITSEKNHLPLNLRSISLEHVTR